MRLSLLLLSLFISSLGVGQLFGPPQVISSNLTALRGLEALDIDGDGDMDVIAGHSEGVKLYENDGMGNFELAHNIGSINSNHIDEVSSLAMADFNSDGEEDLLVSSSNGLSICLNVNEGWSAMFTEVDCSFHTWGSEDIGIQDFDGDGDFDFAFASSMFDYVRFYFNDGQANFTVSPEFFEVGAPIDLKSSDLDNSGSLDLIVPDWSSGGIHWYLNSGSSEFHDSIIAIGNYSIDLAIGDIDEDDDIVSHEPPNVINILFNNGFGDFSESNQPLGEDSLLWTRPLLFDIDSDGDLDLIVGSLGNPDIVAFINNGTGFFTDVETVLTHETDGWIELQEADLDRDGFLDLLVTVDMEEVFWIRRQGGCLDPSACNYDPVNSIDNGSCCYEDCGCTDSIAVNYDSLAFCNDGSCEYVLGCMNSTAQNYDSLATVGDGSCVFDYGGTVFFDENEDGLMGPEEYGLPFQALRLSPNSTILITDDDGNFSMTASEDVLYTISLIEGNLFPYSTTPAAISFNSSSVNWNQNHFFGITNELAEFALTVELYSNGFGYPCDVWRKYSICFRNTGNVSIDGVVELEYDSLFQGHQEITPIDSINGNKVYMGFEDLLPGQMFFYDIRLHTPNVDFIGEFLTSTARVIGTYDGDEIAYGEQELEMEVTCAYDPNDKRVIPQGYSEEHFISEDQELEYLIRFQNTGNAPATDVIIRDTLDQNLDISTLELVANSHSVFTTLKPEIREVEFYFQNIMLPDSVNNEPESHGLVSFKIRPQEGLPLLTELNNKASIFFDNNPPIVTNTTWSTIYDCSLFEVSFSDDGALLTATEGDSYQWYLDGESIDGATLQTFEVIVNGEYAVQVSNNFPCSELSSTVFILVDDINEFSDSPISLFPNPLTSGAVLDLGEITGRVELEITDQKGRVLRKEEVLVEYGQLHLEKRELTSGLYILKIIKDNESHALPFIVR